MVSIWSYFYLNEMWHSFNIPVAKFKWYHWKWVFLCISEFYNMRGMWYNFLDSMGMSYKVSRGKNRYGPWENRLTSPDLIYGLWWQVSHLTTLLKSWDYKCLGNNSIKRKGRDFSKINMQINRWNIAFKNLY